MTEEFFRSLVLGSKLSLFVPAFSGIVSWSKHTTIQKRICAVVGVSRFVELFALGRPSIVNRLLSICCGVSDNNLPGLHLFTLLQFLLILWVYQDFLDKKLSSRGRWFLGFSFIVFAIINAVWIDGIWKLNPHARAVQSLILLGIIFTYLFNLLQKAGGDDAFSHSTTTYGRTVITVNKPNDFTKNEKAVQLEKLPLFWVSAGLLIYFSGSFFIFLAGNYFLPERQTLMAIYGIHSILNILANIFYGIALWVKPAD
ncbi:MAG: hypothetical protein AAFU03_03855 [Bacteroidota bacterium]